MNFAIGKIWWVHFWYTNFWVPDPPPFHWFPSGGGGGGGQSTRGPVDLPASAAVAGHGPAGPTPHNAPGPACAQAVRNGAGAGALLRCATPRTPRQGAAGRAYPRAALEQRDTCFSCPTRDGRRSSVAGFE